MKTLTEYPVKNTNDIEDLQRSAAGSSLHLGAVATGDGTANLTPLGVTGQALHIEMLPPAGAGSNGRATVAVNSLGVIDLLAAGQSLSSAIWLWRPPAVISRCGNSRRRDVNHDRILRHRRRPRRKC